MKCNNCSVVMLAAEHERHNQGIAPLCPSCGEPPLRQYYVCVYCGSTKIMIKEWINPNTNVITPISDRTMLEVVDVPVHNPAHLGDISTEKDSAFTDLGILAEAECYGFCSHEESWRIENGTRAIVLDRSCVLSYRQECEDAVNDRREEDGFGRIRFSDYEDSV